MNNTNGAQVQSAPNGWVSDAQVTSEEMPGFEQAEAAAEYGLQVEFAALQVRARAHTKGVWRAYELAIAQVEVLDAVLRELDEQPESVNGFTRRVLEAALRVHGKKRSEAFEMWADLSKLANADGYEDLNAEDTRKSVAALHAAEHGKAEELLTMQAGRRQRTREREAAELADARDDKAHA